MFSDTEPEDLDTRQEDHVADECRYFCMARPIRPVRQGEELALGDDPLNMRKRGVGADCHGRRAPSQ